MESSKSLLKWMKNVVKMSKNKDIDKYSKTRSWDDIAADYIIIPTPHMKQYFDAVKIDKERWIGHTIEGDSTGGGHSELIGKLHEVIHTVSTPNVVFRRQRRGVDEYIFYGDSEHNNEWKIPPYMKVIVRDINRERLSEFVTAYREGIMRGDKDIVYIKCKI